MVDVPSAVAEEDSDTTTGRYVSANGNTQRSGQGSLPQEPEALSHVPGDRLPGDGASSTTQDEQNRQEESRSNYVSRFNIEGEPDSTECTLKTPRYYRGIFWPSLSYTFKEKEVEHRYQCYSRRQRQKSLIMVNVVDLILKICLAIIYSSHRRVIISNTAEQGQDHSDDWARRIAWTVGYSFLNLSVCLLGWWRCFANDYLHWAAIGTWLLLISQGLTGTSIGFESPDRKVWYMLFIVFVPYTMLPLSLVWCIVIGALTSVAHLIVSYSATDVCSYRILASNSLLYIAVNFVGMYAKSLADGGQRKAFFETHKTMITRLKIKRESQKYWKLFNSVIPDFLAKEIYIDMKNEKVNIKEQQFNNLYIQRYYDVSILYADIKGFTELSGRLSAPALVSLLNDLFGRFDELASGNKCLRIKLLGDCYFCVSGLPERTEEHAFWCVNMGLHMLRAIREVRCSHNTLGLENLDMRIGIHSGTVLCGVLGLLKWQFDLWSQDVTIANHMESGGVPGRVHISSDTKECLKGAFKVEPGEGSSRDPYIQELNLTTYLVDQTAVPKPMEQASKAVNRFSQAPAPSDASRRPSNNSEAAPNNWTGPEMPFQNLYLGSAGGGDSERPQSRWDDAEPDVEDVPPLTEDVEENDILKSIEVSSNRRMRKNNMRTGTLRFREPSLEVKFKGQEEKTFKSNVMCCLVLWLFIVAVQAVMHCNCTTLMIVLGTITIPLVLSFVFVMLAEFEPKKGVPPKKRSITHLFNLSSGLSGTQRRKDAYICVFVTVMSMSSTIKLYVCTFAVGTPDGINIDNGTNYTTTTPQPPNSPCQECDSPEYVVFTWILCLVALTSILKLYYLIKTFLAAINYVVYCGLLVNYYNILPKNATNTSGENDTAAQLPMYIQMLILMSIFLVVVIYHARLVEVTSRLDFLWNLQASEDLKWMEETQRTNELLLEHILPDHVVNHFLSRRRCPEKLFSKGHKEVGVMFAGIPNFHEFYAEEKAIDCMRLLNEIIFDFDKLLLETRFKSIEKIKTIGAIYMAASGLNPESESGEDDCSHLYALVDYAFALTKTLEEINKHSFNRFRLRVGISCGPVVGGVIGARKPVYDIWGNTVNEASRMESTGAMDRIQVTQYTKQLLERYCGFEARGAVNVKGLGKMHTWWAAANAARAVSRCPARIKRDINATNFIDLKPKNAMYIGPPQSSSTSSASYPPGTPTSSDQTRLDTSKSVNSKIPPVQILTDFNDTQSRKDDRGLIKRRIRACGTIEPEQNFSPYTSLTLLDRKGYVLEARGPVEVKGKGTMETWWVVSERGAAVKPDVVPSTDDSENHPRSLAAIVFTMMRKRIYTHPLDSVERPQSGEQGRNIRSGTVPSGSTRHMSVLQRVRTRVKRNGDPESGFHTKTHSMVVRREHSANPASSLSAPHTPTSHHQPPPPTLDNPPKRGIAARIKAASFSYHRPRSELSPRPSPLASNGGDANGAPRRPRLPRAREPRQEPMENANIVDDVTRI